MSADLTSGWEAFQIVWINLLLSGDNAILIALACRQLSPRQRRWGVFLGALGGVILRVVFTLLVVELMDIPCLKAAGSVLLIIIAVKLLVDESEATDVKAKPDLMGAVVSIVMADAVMSLDNVLAIAAAANGSRWLIVFGLVVSVPIVMFGAGFLLKALERFPFLVWAGAGLLGWVAGEMMAGDAFVADHTHRFVDHATLEWMLPAATTITVLAAAFAIEAWRQWRQDQTARKTRRS